MPRSAPLLIPMATRASEYGSPPEPPARRCAAAVRNVRATPSDDLFMLPRLTIRRSTDQTAFAAVVTGSDGPVLRHDRLLTAGWASVRRARRAAKWIRGYA